MDTRGWRLSTFCARGDAGIYLFSMHGNRFWRLDTKTNLVAIDCDHKNLHLVPYSDGLTRSSRQNEHVISVFWSHRSLPYRSHPLVVTRILRQYTCAIIGSYTCV